MHSAQVASTLGEAAPADDAQLSSLGADALAAVLTLSRNSEVIRFRSNPNRSPSPRATCPLLNLTSFAHSSQRERILA